MLLFCDIDDTLGNPESPEQALSLLGVAEGSSWSELIGQVHGGSDWPQNDLYAVVLLPVVVQEREDGSNEAWCKSTNELFGAMLIWHPVFKAKKKNRKKINNETENRMINMYIALKF